MNTKVAVIKNTGSQIIGKIISGGTTFLISILLARSLGPVGFGDFTKITTFIPLFYLLNDFGLNAAYLTIRTKFKRPEMFATLGFVRILFSLILMFLSLAFTIFLPGSNGTGYHPLVKIGIILFAPSILFQALITTANALFQEHLSYEKSTFAILIGSFTTLTFLFFITPLFVPEAALLVSIIALLVGSGITAFLSFIFARNFLKDIPFRISKSDVRLLLWTSIPLGMTLLTNVIYSHADSIILTVTRTTREVGIYGLAYKIFEFPLAIPTFFMNAMFPLFLNAKENPILLKSRLRKTMVLLFIMGVVSALLGWLTSPYLILIRPDFQESVPLLRILVTGLPIFFLTSFTMWTLVTFEKRWILFSIYSIFMLVNIIANILFIPVYGATASAYITILSELGILIVSSIFLFSYTKDNRNSLTSV